LRVGIFKSLKIFVLLTNHFLSISIIVENFYQQNASK
jgi:hypothetical protein